MNYSLQFLKSLDRASEGGMRLIVHMRALLILRQNNPHGLAMSSVADLLGIGTASMTEVADVLERLGLAKRSQAKYDRRSVELKITDEGVEFVNRITKA